MYDEQPTLNPVSPNPKPFPPLARKPPVRVTVAQSPSFLFSQRRSLACLVGLYVERGSHHPVCATVPEPIASVLCYLSWPAFLLPD